jgi:hypothetical protein
VKAGETCTATLPTGTTGNINQCLKSGSVEFFCPEGNTATGTKLQLKTSKQILCKVCALEEFTDTNNKAKVMDGVVYWGPNQINGKVDESMIKGYSVCLLTACGLPIKCEVQSVTANTCCNPKAYSYTFKDKAIPEDATHISVVPWGVDGAAKQLSLSSGIQIALTDVVPPIITTAGGTVGSNTAMTTLLAAIVAMVVQA